MNEKYPIYELDQAQRLRKLSEDGMLRKNWYKHPDLGECLFKEATPSQSILGGGRMDWTEKVVWELTQLLNLPAARSELATGYFDGSDELTPGVLSVNCIPPLAQPIAGREFLMRVGDYNPSDSNQYTIDIVLNALNAINVLPPSRSNSIQSIDTGAKLFVGYLLLDALVSNVDRHDRNWSVMSVDGNLELMPSYDHGLSLAGDLLDNDIANLEVADYAKYNLSPFKQGKRSVPVAEVFDHVAKLYPEAATIWQNQLAKITPEQISEIIDRIPDDRITPISAKFAKNLLAHNQAQILSLQLSTQSQLKQLPTISETSQLAPIQAQVPSPEAISSVDSTTTEDPNLTAWNALHSESGTVTISPLAPTPSEDPNLAAWEALHSNLDSIISGSNRIEVSSPNPTLSQEDGESDTLGLDR